MRAEDSVERVRGAAGLLVLDGLPPLLVHVLHTEAGSSLEGSCKAKQTYFSVSSEVAEVFTTL